MTERDRQIETLLAQVEADKVGVPLKAKRQVVHSPVLADLSLYHATRLRSRSILGHLNAKLFEVGSMENEKEYSVKSSRYARNE